MAKKFLVLALCFVSFIMLSACTGQGMDGTYYKFRNSTSYDEERVVVSEEVEFKISGETLTYKDGSHYNIDKEKRTISKGSSVTSYYFKDGILEVNDETYVLKESSKYKELVKLQKEGKYYKEN